MIPPTIHFIWIACGEKLSEDKIFCIRSATVNTSCKIILHTDDPTIKIPGVELRVRDFPTEINGHKFDNSDVSKMKTYPGKGARHVSHLKDIIRCEILFEEGGIYSDLDTAWWRNPWEFFNNKDKLVVGWSNQGYKVLCNAVMMSEPGHPALKIYRDWIVSNWPPTKYWGIANPYKLWKDRTDVTFVKRNKFFAISHHKLQDKTFTDVTFDTIERSPCSHLYMSMQVPFGGEAIEAVKKLIEHYDSRS